MGEHAPWRVSAIIPTYNRAAFLPETIGCLLAQTSPPEEIIVVDDGSTDATASVVQAFGAKVRYARIENRGAPVARNVGAAVARGEWFWFCDSDDLWRPTYLAQCRRLATAAPYPRFIFGNFQLVRDGAWEPGDKFATAPAGFWQSVGMTTTDGGALLPRPLYSDLLDFQPIFPSTVVMARSLFEDVGGFDARFCRTGSEDFEFTLRCASHAPMAAVTEPLVGIRRHGANFSDDHLRTLRGEVEILRHAKARHPAAADHLARIDREIARRTLGALQTAFGCDDYQQVRALAGELGHGAMDPRSRAKVFIAGLPRVLRDPLVALARLKNAA